MSRADLCVLILTHGRPDRVATLRALETHGYTGAVFLVIDDEDKAADEYRRLHGERVVMFSKAALVDSVDTGDNFPQRNTVLFARHAAFEIAKRLGFRYFVTLDDDYSGWYYRFDREGRYGAFKLDPLDWLFSALADYLAATPFATLAISQGGDHIGGSESKKAISAKRKAMNVFVCDTGRPFRYVARMNDDVTTYVNLQRRGLPFLTFLAAQVNQAETQSRAGGLTEMYEQFGTYVKSFYSVMFDPSCVRVASLGDPRVGGAGYKRLHHVIDWNATAPAILHERHRKAA